MWIGNTIVAITLALATAGAAPDRRQPASTRSAAATASYVNERFRFRVDYPVPLLTPQGAGADEAGETFRAEGAEVRVFGSAALPEGSLREAYAAQLAENRETVQYRRLTPDFFVLAGIEETRVYYRKVMAAGPDRFLVLEASYETAARATFDPVVREMARSLAAL